MLSILLAVFLVPTVFGTVSSLHPISFVMIFILVSVSVGVSSVVLVLWTVVTVIIVMKKRNSESGIKGIHDYLS